MSASDLKFPPRKWRGTRGIVWIVVLMLLASVGIRLAGGTGEAIAREFDALANTPPAEAHVGTCTPPPNIANLLAALTDERAAIQRRENALADRIAALRLAEQEIERNLAALQEAERKLAATIEHTSVAAEDDLVRLTAVYENMKPKEAASLFAEMAPEFAAGFLGRMRPDAAAAIMAGLEPDTAYSISVVLAGRNARAPSE